MIPEGVRRDIPILERVIYMNTASSAPKPWPVIKAMVDWYHETVDDSGWSETVAGEETKKKVEEARRVIGALLGVKWKNIVFTKNCTEAVHTVIHGIDWSPGDEVIVSDFEHFCVLAPLGRLVREKGVKLHIVQADKDGFIDPDEIGKLVNKKTRMVAIAHVENFGGSIQHLREIAEVVKAKSDALCLTDAAQAPGCIPVNVERTGFDFYCSSGHKWLLGPVGTGLLLCNGEAAEGLKPLILGRSIEEDARVVPDIYVDTSSSRPFPYKFEVGTKNTLGIVGLSRAVRYIGELGIQRIRRWNMKLTEYAIETLSMIKGLEVYGSKDVRVKTSIVAFNVKGQNPTSLVKQLWRRAKILSHNGQLGRPLLNIQGVKNAIRISLHCFNTFDEIDTLAKSLKEIREGKD